MYKDAEDDNDSAIALIKAFFLPPKSLDILIDTFIKQAVIFGKNIPANAKDQLRSIFTSNDFLHPTVKTIKNIFDHKEISHLTDMCRSKVMVQMLEHSKELFTPLYEAMQKQIDEIS